MVLVAVFGARARADRLALNAKLRDVNYLTVVLNLAFYSAPIIYPISLVQQDYATHPWARIYELNPLVQFVEAMKDLMYSLTIPPLACGCTCWSSAA